MEDVCKIKDDRDAGERFPRRPEDVDGCATCRSPSSSRPRCDPIFIPFSSFYFLPLPFPSGFCSRPKSQLPYHSASVYVSL